MDWIKKYRKSPEFVAMVSALIMGYITHNFALVNVMHNIDDIGNQPYGYGVGLTSGRWLLTLLGDTAQSFGLNLNLPFVNGLVFLILISIAAGFLVSVFAIKSKLSAGMIGMLLVVFPSAATALIYRFTAPFYAMAFLMATLAVWVSERQKWGVLLAALLITCSLGIYQAYVALSIGMFVLLLIQRAFLGEPIPALLRRGLRACLTLILGLLGYFLCLKICLALYGTVLSDYNGMNNMAGLALKNIPGQVVKAFYDFCKFPLTNYCSLAGNKLIKIAYLLLGVASFGLVLYLLFQVKKDVIRVAAVILLLAAFPVGVNFVEVMSPGAWMYTMMVYAFVLVPCAPLILLECIPEKVWRPAVVKCLSVVTIALIMAYGYQIHANYTANYYINRQTENYISSIVTQVRMTEKFDADKKWALLGNIQDPLLDSPWEYELSNGGLFGTERTLNDISRYYWFWTYIGYRLPMADAETIENLRALPEVKSMPCWPAEGSIKVVGDTVVIKFEELS
ncbi:MAG: glucosyltransferase domain-containing protein [Eubacteriales bacterium]|nr:glucosyltransferase domain-containing protein [Eubacteriales bacterium]